MFIHVTYLKLLFSTKITKKNLNNLRSNESWKKLSKLPKERKLIGSCSRSSNDWAYLRQGIENLWSGRFHRKYPDHLPMPILDVRVWSWTLVVRAADTRRPIIIRPTFEGVRHIIWGQLKWQICLYWFLQFFFIFSLHFAYWKFHIVNKHNQIWSFLSFVN